EVDSEPHEQRETPFVPLVEARVDELADLRVELVQRREVRPVEIDLSQGVAMPLRRVELVRSAGNLIGRLRACWRPTRGPALAIATRLRPPHPFGDRRFAGCVPLGPQSFGDVPDRHLSSKLNRAKASLSGLCRWH